MRLSFTAMHLPIVRMDLDWQAGVGWLRQLGVAGRQATAQAPQVCMYV